MKTIRTALAALFIALLTLGYITSQVASLQGWAPSYAKLVDRPEVKAISLLMIVTVVAFAFLPEKTEEDR